MLAVACPESHPGPAVAVPHVLAGRGETPCEGGSPMKNRSWLPEVRDIGDRIAGLSLARAAELHRYLECVHGVRVSASVVEERLRIVTPDPVLPPPPTECW